MKRFLTCAIVLFVICSASGVIFAQEQKSAEQGQRDLLIANITALRNQELRVAILEQLMDEERAQLLRMQAIFSDQYDLDTDKFRSGMYIYDDKVGQFVERDLKSGIAQDFTGDTTE
ncbi:MAG: hypothetical protein ISS26_07395 [Candidatus Omnitrophica bacterium]|nr:hypothetical protein [Candidatus Omnitrophota bacterium]